ncbi:predicted protein [Postia placenta Mad-698-R]|uniref:EthD domain-containing protein n=1 Tax=Postia placenta MAD-698-R-SB12 TaxID=670580 RepID=A0A1X6MXU4_9APHY|nr:hypothetical protein POSPLADRAFT_1146734 [Postia placenta MAD-698-R-SB12]EED80752.1 predicted protein [Postia placenta Mad-698-R]OSX61198.1 hypothetical protein POSPLADRAFT_1146734 [Postia placenta MAD-698-R-SB12]
MAPPAILFVFSEPGSNVTEEEFHDWYDNEHIPLLVDISAFRSWTRWAAVDGTKPAYGAAYDLESYDVMQQPSYKALVETRSEREKDILKRIQVVDWRIYELHGGPTTPPSALFDPAKPASYAAFVFITTKPEFEEEFNKWYDEEHIPLLAKVRGWIRSRRFRLKDWGHMGVEVTKEPPKYFAVHEWATLDGTRSEEYRAALESPWTKRMEETFLARDVRVMSLLKTWDRPSLL